MRPFDARRERYDRRGARRDSGPYSDDVMVQFLVQIGGGDDTGRGLQQFQGESQDLHA